MKRLALLVVAAAIVTCIFGQNANKKDVGTPSQAKRTQQAGPLEITAVGTEYGVWQSQFASFVGWGVRVHVRNTTDQEVSEKLDGAGLQVTNSLGKRCSISSRLDQVFAQVNLRELYSQGLQGALLFYDTGSGVRILNGDTSIGELTGVIDVVKKQFNFNLRLAPGKGATFVFVFDSPQESKPQTLAWPKAKPIDLE
jgi:hypothetical protein